MMPYGRLEALRREFPFLRSFPDNYDVEIKQADYSLMKKGRRMSLLSSYYPSIEVILLDYEKKEICELGVIEKKFVWWKPKTWFPKTFSETVEEAFSRLGESFFNKVFAVAVVFYGTESEYIEIHMPPRRFSIAEWMNECLILETYKISKELDEIDDQ